MLTGFFYGHVGSIRRFWGNGMKRWRSGSSQKLSIIFSSKLDVERQIDQYTEKNDEIDLNNYLLLLT